MKLRKEFLSILLPILLLAACAENSDTPTTNTTGSSNSSPSTSTTTPEANKDTSSETTPEANSDTETTDTPSEVNTEEEMEDNAEESIEETVDETSSDSTESTSDTAQETQETPDDDAMRLTFQTTNLEGQAVTSDIFKDYDLTMINIWATWCGPCVNEMPDLQLVNEALPENVNFLTLCSDGASQTALANQILTASNATFQTIVPDDALDAQLMQYIMAFPTTIFVDSTGALTGGVIEGAPYDVVNSYLDAVDQVLAIQ